MKSPLIRLLLLALITAFSTRHAVGEAPQLQWETSGFEAPESVVYDAVRDCFYVSNLASRGDERIPGDGFISKLARDGSILHHKWATGLEDPKGLAVANDRLYVGDTPDMVEISLATGDVLARYRPIDGAAGEFNDCTVDPLGNVYVFSSRLRQIYRLHAGEFAPWYDVDTSRTGGLNGLRAETDRLVLGGWSVTGPDGQTQLGHLSTVRFRDQHLDRIGTGPLAHVDGIEPDGLGGYTVTDWLTGKLMHVPHRGEPSLLLPLEQGTADHEYLIEDGLLIVPSMLENKVRAFSWKPALPAVAPTS